MATQQTTINKDQIAKKWLSIALDQIKKKIKRLKVWETGSLYESVDGNVSEMSGGNAYKAEIMYNYYGIFPDMGVGSGKGKGDQTVAKLTGNQRKPKRWTKEIAAQRHRFGELMGEAFANEAVEGISGSLKKKYTFYQ